MALIEAHRALMQEAASAEGEQSRIGSSRFGSATL